MNTPRIRTEANSNGQKRISHGKLSRHLYAYIKEINHPLLPSRHRSSDKVLGLGNMAREDLPWALAPSRELPHHLLPVERLSSSNSSVRVFNTDDSSFLCTFPRLVPGHNSLLIFLPLPRFSFSGTLWWLPLFPPNLLYLSVKVHSRFSSPSYSLSSSPVSWPHTVFSSVQFSRSVMSDSL